MMEPKDRKDTQSSEQTKNIYDDDNIPGIDLKDAQPLPESSRPRKDGPGGD